MYRFYDKKIENPNAGYIKHVIFMFYDKERKPVSSITLVEFKKDLTDWIMISELQTADEYEGRGFATKLLDSSLKKIKQDYPDKDIFLMEFPNRVIASICEKSGFRPVTYMVPQEEEDSVMIMVYGYPTPRRMSQLEMLGRQAAIAIINILKSDRVEDKGPFFYGRKHTRQIAHPSVFNDQMVIYAGLRSDTSKISSLKLDDNAQKEIEDTKIEWS